MGSEFANVIRPEPLEDAILRLAKKYDYCAKDKDVFGQEARDTYWCVASDLKYTLKGEYVIGWENDNGNVGWIPCEIKMPEDIYDNKKVINVLVTTDSGNVTKVQRIKNTYKNEYWYWGRIHGNPIAWMPLPKAYKKVFDV